MKAPEPGIYKDVPFEEYQSWEAMNASTLVHGLTSMKHLKAAIDGHMGYSSKDMNFGSALHCRLLEPSIYESEWNICGPCSAVIGSGERKGQKCGKNGSALKDGEWVCGVHGKGIEPPENVITPHEANRIERAREELNKSEAIRLIQTPGWFECSIVFKLHGVLCKGRLDKYMPEHLTILDIKKVQVGKAIKGIFHKQIENLHYDFKAAFYCEGMRILTGESPDFHWLAVEDNEPHDSNRYFFSNAYKSICVDEVKETINQYLQSKKSGNWPGYIPPDYTKDGEKRDGNTIYVSDWKKNRHEKEHPEL